MFTGIIEQVGTIKATRNRKNYSVLSVAADFRKEPLVDGESISCDGACLTVVSSPAGSFVVEASQETAARTILSSYRVGSKLNLERALRADSRLGGHFVSGHIDTVGSVASIDRVGESVVVTVAFDESFDPLVVEKGSIALNGISLTVNAVRAGICTVNVIPFTWEATTIGNLKSGIQLNLEFDLIGKYILKNQKALADGKLTARKLIESGW